MGFWDKLLGSNDDKPEEKPSTEYVTPTGPGTPGDGECNHKGATSTSKVEGGKAVGYSCSRCGANWDA
jgi:hypothetical protein